MSIFQNYRIEEKEIRSKSGNRENEESIRHRCIRFADFQSIIIIGGGTMHIYAWRARRPSSYRDRRTSVSQINHSNVALQVRSISDDDSRLPSIKIICPRLLLTFFFSFLSFFSVPYPSFLLISLSYHKITRYLVMRETKDSIDFSWRGKERNH